MGAKELSTPILSEFPGLYSVAVLETEEARLTDQAAQESSLISASVDLSNADLSLSEQLALVLKAHSTLVDAVTLIKSTLISDNNSLSEIVSDLDSQIDFLSETAASQQLQITDLDTRLNDLEQA